jgi:hypothetical protein
VLPTAHHAPKFAFHVALLYNETGLSLKPPRRDGLKPSLVGWESLPPGAEVPGYGEPRALEAPSSAPPVGATCFRQVFSLRSPELQLGANSALY